MDPLSLYQQKKCFARLVVTVNLVLQMVNEQIGTENMKRRVDIEHRRQRKLAKVQEKMWNDFADCQANGYDWAPRRAQYESQLNDIQAQKSIFVPDEVDAAEPDHLSGINRQFPAERLRSRAHGKAAELGKNSLLTDAAGQPSDWKQEQRQLPPGESDPAYAAMLDWFKVIRASVVWAVRILWV